MRALLRQFVPLFLTGCVCLGAAQGADVDPKRRALAERIIDATGAEAAMSAANMTTRTREAFVRMLRAAVPSTVSKSVIDAAVDKELKNAREVARQEDIKAYATHFTEAQLNDLLAFHNSPTGRAMAAQMPAIMAEKDASARRLVKEGLRRMVASVCKGQAGCPK
jgi:hypothetical protein